MHTYVSLDNIFFRLPYTPSPYAMRPLALCPRACAFPEKQHPNPSRTKDPDVEAVALN